MKRLLILGFIIFLAFAASRNVSAATFDFDALPYPAGPATIEAYMQGIYGSDITVVNAIVGNGVSKGPLGPDHYIQSDLSLGYDWFEIRFETMPITSASFDWGATWNEFVAEADGAVIFDSGYTVYQSGFFSTEFLEPVTVLRFHDHGCGEVEIDNLVVASVPIPGSLWLLGSCVIGLAAMRRRICK